MTYDDELKMHVAKYKREKLKVVENGVWRNREYEHILPVEQRYLNLLKPYRQEFKCRFESGQFTFNIEDLPHLNSSQAMGANLFFPFHVAEWYSPFLQALRIEDEPIQNSQFEYVMPDQTNVDILLVGASGRRVFVEVKLKERGFGAANSKKVDYARIFQKHSPQLESIVRNDHLTFRKFKQYYQLFRYLSFLSPESSDVFCLLVPRRNELFQKDIPVINEILRDEQKAKVKVAYLEDVVERLISSFQNDNQLLLQQFILFKEKYILF